MDYIKQYFKMSVTKALKIIDVLFITKGKCCSVQWKFRKTSHIGLSSSSQATDLPAYALHVMRNLSNFLKTCKVKSDKLLEKRFYKNQPQCVGRDHDFSGSHRKYTHTKHTQLLPRVANKCFDNKWKFLLSDVYTSWFVSKQDNLKIVMHNKH